MDSVALAAVRVSVLSEAIEALEEAWDEACAGNKNEAACESCRAYADAILTLNRKLENDRG